VQAKDYKQAMAAVQRAWLVEW